jgi:hypothetical protein
VPFRLTRNLANFFTPFGVEGIFVTSLIAGAQAGPLLPHQLGPIVAGHARLAEGRSAVC